MTDCIKKHGFIHIFHVIWKLSVQRKIKSEDLVKKYEYFKDILSNIYNEIFGISEFFYFL
jgi:hypothetical protein